MNVTTTERHCATCGKTFVTSQQDNSNYCCPVCLRKDD